MAGPVITIAVLADADKAKRELRETGDAAEGMGGKFSLSAGKVAAAAAGILAGGAAVSFLKDSVAAAAEDESEQLLYEAQLRNAGASDEVVKAFDEQVAAGMRLKGFTDTDLRTAYSQFYQQSRSVEQAQKDVALAMDIARAAGVPLQTATDAVTKAQEGNTRGLAALLPQYTELIKNSDDATLVYDTLTAAVQGQADTFANSSQGQLERAKIQYGELQEEIGAKVLPVVLKLTDFLTTKVIPAVRSTSQFVSENREYFAAAAIGITVALIPALVGWAISAGAAAVATLAAAAPVIALALVIAGLAAGVIWLYQNWDKATAAMERAWNWAKDLATWENLKRVVLALATSGLSELERKFGIINAVAGPILDGIHAGVDGIADAVGWLIGQVERAANAIRNLPGAGVVRGIGGAVSGVGGFVGGLFADGGVVPGRYDQAVPIIAHGGEVVLNPRQQAALLNGGTGGTTYIYMPNGITPGAVDDARRRYALWNQ